MKRILVALDGSSRAPAVLAAAASLAEMVKARLVLYRALNIPPEITLELFHVTDRSIEDIMRSNALSELERLAASVPKERIEKITTTLAVPWDGICRTAKELDADLVVIGSHGYGGLDRLLGTTAGKVVNHADRNVLVVRTPL